MCALCAILHFQAYLADIVHLQYVLAVYTRFLSSDCFSCRLRSLEASLHLAAYLSSCGAKVRHENHSDKLLCENFTMKRIFRPKASFLPHRFRPNATPFA